MDKKSCFYRLFLTCLTLAAACLLSGCAGESGSAKNSNSEVAGFLFHFDQRKETRSFLKLAEKDGEVQGVSWLRPGETSDGDEYHTSADPELISRIYKALSNVIVIGNVVGSVKDEGGFIAFTLPDDSECRFDFPTESVILLSAHYYSVETDGELWKLLEENS